MSPVLCVNVVSPQLLSNEANFSVYRLQQVDTAGHLRLDNSAAKALSLEALPGEPPCSSLIGLLNKCHTPQGQRLLSQWLKQPLIDKSCIGKLRGSVSSLSLPVPQTEERLDLVEVFFLDASLRTNLQDELRHIPDFHRISRRLSAHRSSLQVQYLISMTWDVYGFHRTV